MSKYDKCDICGNLMKKSTSPFGYVTHRCVNCGYEEVGNIGFKLKKFKIKG